MVIVVFEKKNTWCHGELINAHSGGILVIAHVPSFKKHRHQLYVLMYAIPFHSLYLSLFIWLYDTLQWSLYAVSGEWVYKQSLT